MQIFSPAVEPWPSALPRPGNRGTAGSAGKIREKQGRADGGSGTPRSAYAGLDSSRYYGGNDAPGRWATREDIAAGLTAVIRSAEPAAERTRVLDLTDLMLDLLMNEANRRWDRPHPGFRRKIIG